MTLKIFLDEKSFHCLKQAIPTGSRSKTIIANAVHWNSNVVLSCNEAEARNLLLYAGHCPGVIAAIHRVFRDADLSLENLRDELTSSVLANIGSMRHLVQMKERTISMEEIRAELRANGLPLRLETLIGDLASVVWQSREQLERFHSKAVRLHLLDFVACQLSPAQLADCVLEALATLDTAERNQIYTHFAQRQNALRYRVEEMRKMV